MCLTNLHISLHLDNMHIYNVSFQTLSTQVTIGLSKAVQPTSSEHTKKPKVITTKRVKALNKAICSLDGGDRKLGGPIHWQFVGGARAGGFPDRYVVKYIFKEFLVPFRVVVKMTRRQCTWSPLNMEGAIEVLSIIICQLRLPIGQNSSRHIPAMPAELNFRLLGSTEES